MIFYPQNEIAHNALAACLTNDDLLEKLQSYDCFEHNEGVGLKMLLTPNSQKIEIDACCETFVNFILRKSVELSS